MSKGQGKIKHMYLLHHQHMEALATGGSFCAEDEPEVFTHHS